MNHQDLATISQIENYIYLLFLYKYLIPIEDCPSVLKFLDYFIYSLNHICV